MLRPPPRSTLFPYTTLSDLVVGAACDTQREAAAPQRTVDPGLTAALATVTPSDRLVVIVNYDETVTRSEEHTSELQSHSDLVCRLLLEKKNDLSIQACPALR